MTLPPLPSLRAHPAVELFAQEFRAGRMGRREFLTRATALGLGAAMARGLAGLPASAQPAAPAPHRGGTLRMQMAVRPLTDPRLWDWPEMATLCRGWLEYLVEYQPDGTLEPMLLESWEVDDSATRYLLHLRRGVRWNTGAPFTAADLASNFERWCDGTVAGNSMADRMGALRDRDTGRMRPGAVEVVDDHTLRLQLSRPDIAIIVNCSDYPAAVVHPSFDGGDPVAQPVGTGPYLPEVHVPGSHAVMVRNPDHDWWGGDRGAFLDRIEFRDLGTDPSLWLSAMAAGVIDILHETVGETLEVFDAIGMQRSEVSSAATLCVRFNQTSPPFDNADLRRALVRAVDNAVVMELGYGNRGMLGENHHVSPIHPEYAPLPPQVPDRASASAAVAALGLGDHPFELLSLDDSWQALTCDAVAAQLIDAGINVSRRRLPEASYLAGWKSFPFSATSWGMRPLGVQVLELAYRSGAAWNETGFADPEFDALLDMAGALPDAKDRRDPTGRMQRMLQDAGIMIQPYWRTLFRHARRGVRGAGMHPLLEVQYHRYWIEPAD